MRLAGDHENARQGFERSKRMLDEEKQKMTPEQLNWLDAQYDRYYGRFLKDQGSGDYKRAMQKAVRYLKEARNKFKNETLFRDVQKFQVRILWLIVEGHPDSAVPPDPWNIRIRLTSATLAAGPKRNA